MTRQIMERVEGETLDAIRPNPPPPERPRREPALFQSLDELREKHGNLPATKDRLYFWVGGLLVGSVVFGALYLMILFLE